jgi:hypothetical protein
MNMVVQFAPWIVFAVVSEYDWRLGLAAGLILQLVLILAVRPIRIGVLNAAMLAFFLVVGTIAVLSPDSPLQDYVGSLANGWFAVVAVVSLAVRHPFTLDFSRGTVPAEVEASPVFMAVNRTITWVWAGCWAGMAIAGVIGTAAGLSTLDTIATVVLLVVAIKFTIAYPQRVRTRHQAEAATISRPFA